MAVILPWLAKASEHMTTAAVESAREITAAIVTAAMSFLFIFTVLLYIYFRSFRERRGAKKLFFIIIVPNS